MDPRSRLMDPGSSEAIEQGCRCPVLDNCRGKGRGGDGKRWGWWISANCPMHGSLEHKWAGSADPRSAA